MTGNWVVGQLDDFCDVQYGTRVVKKRDAGTKFPVYGGGGKTFSVDDFNRENRVIVSRFGMSPSCTRYVEGKFFLNDSGLTLTPKDNRLLQRFLDYQTLSLNDEIYRLGRGAAQKNLDVNSLKLIPITFPGDTDTQLHIIETLDRAFEGIDQASTNASRNQDSAKELFESALNSVFLHDTENWTETELSNICSIKHGFAFKSQFFASEGDYVVLTPGSFHETGGFRDQGEKTKFYDGDIPDGYILQKDDFLIAMTEQAVGLLGSSLIVPESNRYLHNQRLGLVQVSEGVEWCNDFFLHQFNTQNFRRAVQETASGLKVRHTSPKKLGAIKVRFPNSLAAQQDIANRLNELQSSAVTLQENNRIKISKLSQLRKSVLAKAFSGKLGPEQAQFVKKEAVA